MNFNMDKIWETFLVATYANEQNAIQEVSDNNR